MRKLADSIDLFFKCDNPRVLSLSVIPDRIDFMVMSSYLNFVQYNITFIYGYFICKEGKDFTKDKVPIEDIDKSRISHVEYREYDSNGTLTTHNFNKVILSTSQEMETLYNIINKEISKRKEQL